MNFRRAVWLMAFTAGAVVANNYYNQPLLGELARDFQISERQAALIATWTQLGYATGLLLILPLGDLVERRRAITVLMLLSPLMLVCFALSPGFPAVVVLGALLGFVSVVPQFLPPMAAQLAPPGQAGRAVGMVMSGLLLGIILSRFAGGAIGGWFGWQAVYLVAAVLMLALLVALRRTLPVMRPNYAGSYASLMRTLMSLTLRHAALRRIALVGALQFGAFSLFWTTLIFALEGQWQQRASTVAGLLALAGAIGVLSAPHAGKLAENMPSKRVISISGSLMVVAFLLMATGTSLVWLVPAVILLDLGMQVSHVSSMAEVLSLEPSASSRLNTIYMVIRFVGGALGTLVGSLAWQYQGWIAVCATGFLFTVLALVMNHLGGRDKKAAIRVTEPSSAMGGDHQ